MITTPCKGCGRSIVWKETKDGKKIPLDPVAPVYKLDADGYVSRAIGELTRRPTALVSHFATCPKANDFSGKGKKA